MSWLRYVPKRCRGEKQASDARLWASQTPSFEGLGKTMVDVPIGIHCATILERNYGNWTYLTDKKQQPFSSRRCDFGAPLMDDLLLQTPILKIAALFRDHTDRSMSRHMLGYCERVGHSYRRII